MLHTSTCFDLTYIEISLVILGPLHKCLSYCTTYFSTINITGIIRAIIIISIVI